MATTFPALRGHMGDSDFFATVLTFGEVARMVDFVEDIDEWDQGTDPEAKTQRKLNTARVERELVPYLLESDDRFYSALTVEVRPSLTEEGQPAIPFEPIGPPLPGGVEYGTTVLDGTQVLYALDGQHRLKSIQRAIRLNPSLSREQISVILVPFKSHRRSQLLFSDLNRYAKAPSKSISLLFSHRDPLVTVAKRLTVAVPLLTERVEFESTSLSKHTPHVITLSSLYEMTRTLSEGRTLDTDDAIEEEFLRQAGVWELMVRSIPPWNTVAERREHPAYLRQKLLPMHGVCQQAIAIAVTNVIRLGQDLNDVLPRFADTDWTITNHQWQGVAVQGRRVNNTSVTIRNLGALLTFQFGLPVSASEAESLASIMRGRGDTPPPRLLESARGES